MSHNYFKRMKFLIEFCENIVNKRCDDESFSMRLPG